MKLRRIKIENVRSFLAPAELRVDGDISILIGPNGGGKTNLLDTVSATIRHHLLKSWTPYKSATPENPQRMEFRVNDTFQPNQLEKHSKGAHLDQRIEVELEATDIDIKNIRSMNETAEDLADFAETGWHGTSIRNAKDWDPDLIKTGDRFRYEIVNGSIQKPDDPAASLFRGYLGLFEAYNRLRSERKEDALLMPMMTIPANRAGAFQSSLALAGYNESDYKKQVDAANSRLGAGSLVMMAIGRIAGWYRLLIEDDDGRARKRFEEDERVRSLTELLASLGYAWKLVCTDPQTNQYDIQLTKQGTSFLVTAASSGEKELLTYLFAIFGLNVRNALILIDEPELHLHPQWQASLLKLFEQLVADTGNQFLLATHSPVFVSPVSIQYVSRVFSTNQESKISRLNSDTLPEPRLLFSIINSQNNERVFFTDVVVLVEGISDRLFFEAIFTRFTVTEGSTRRFEIIEVGGKGFFAAYEEILKACSVDYMIIADRDYINEVGSGAVKALFEDDRKRVSKDVLRNPKSYDGAALFDRLEEATNSGNLTDLIDLWSYIKATRTRMKEILSPDEERAFAQELTELRAKNIYVLANGNLENYLPLGYKSKDIRKLLVFLSADFWGELPLVIKPELETIAGSLKARLQ